MEVTFFRFNKCRNETKQPTGGTVINVRLKENCSILEPRLILSTPSWDYNYFHIPSFGRYYFVTNFTYIGNQTYQVDGTCDPMASFRDDILHSTQYISRAATGYDPDIIDNMYPAKAGRQNNIQSLNFIPDDFAYGDCSFIIGVIGKSAGYCGIPVTYYLLYLSEMRKLNDYLFNSGNYGSLISDDIVKAFFNPMDAIVSCVVIPRSITLSPMTEANIDFGWFETSGITAYIIQPYNYSLPTQAFNIYKPGEDYIKSPPFTQYSLFIPFIGRLELPGEKLYSYARIFITYNLDLVTGALSATVFAGNGDAHTENDLQVTESSGQLGAVVAMAQLRSDVLAFGVNAAGAISSLFSARPADMVSTAISAIDAITPDPQTKGTNGALGSLFAYRETIFTCYYFAVADRTATRLGRPVCKTDVISNYNGYCLCKAAEVEPDGAYASEIDEITGYMNGGFYVN